MTGPVVIDYKGDRIMDYQVWYLASDGNKFDGYMKIPLSKAGRNTTACVEWLVICILCLCVIFLNCFLGVCRGVYPPTTKALFPNFPLSPNFPFPLPPLFHPPLVLPSIPLLPRSGPLETS